MGIVCIAALIILFKSSNGTINTPVSGSAVIINEVMTSNKGAVPDNNGDFSDWVELYNKSDAEIDISGYGLTDDKLSAAKFVLPAGTKLAPKNYLVIYCSGNADGAFHAGFRLSASDDLVLMDSSGKPLDSMALKAVTTGSSLGRDPENLMGWLELSYPSPGFPNTEAGSDAYKQTQYQSIPTGLYINEFMASNLSVLRDKDGDCSDWIELYNSTDKAIVLSDYGLSDDAAQPVKWKFPAGTSIPANGYMLVFCSGKGMAEGQAELHTTFSLRAYSEDVVLCMPNGKIIDSYTYSSQQGDHAMARQPDGTGEFTDTVQISPGFENTEAGFNKYQELHAFVPGTLYISEALSANYSYYQAADGEYYDWIELHNDSGASVDLTGYALSDNANNPGKWFFPNCTIEPGEYMLVLASGNDVKDVQKKNLETNFALDSGGDTVYFFDPSGNMLDKLSLSLAHADVSVGRTDAKVLFYTKPTPGSANSGGMPGYADMPMLSLAAGAYSGAQKVDITTDDPDCTIRYTLDGSIPTSESKKYTGAISINSPTVLRARAFKSGVYASDTATATYLIDSPHTLPVVSLVSDNEGLFSQETGIYVNYNEPWERQCHFDVIDQKGALEFSQDAMLRIFGAYSRMKNQKGFSIIARGGYGGSSFEHSFFKNRDIDVYKSVILRASGQESTISRMRDIVITSLFEDGTGAQVQAYRQCVVYINGEYWGVYNLREKITKYFIAAHYGIQDVESIDILVGNGAVISGSNADYKAMVEWAGSHDLSKDSNYEYICSIMDVENFAQYCALQVYVGNTDTGNIKYWRSSETDNKWRWIAYDFCWAMNSSDTVGYKWNSLAKYTSEKGHGVASMFSTVLIRSLLKNAEFKALFLQECAKMANEVFTYEKVCARVDECQAAIDEEMKRDTQKWTELSYEGWKKSVNRIREFAQNRKEYFVYYVKEQFGLSTSRCTELFGIPGDAP